MSDGGLATQRASIWIPTRACTCIIIPAMPASVVITGYTELATDRASLEAAASSWVKRPGRLDNLCLAGVALAGAMDAQELSQDRHVLILATAVGCLESDHAYWSGVMESGAAWANPRVFAHTLPNVVLGEIAIRFGLTGDQLCISAGRAGALTALAEGAQQVSSGAADRALVFSIDPIGPALTRVYGALHRRVSERAAVAWRLEREGDGTHIASWRCGFDPSVSTQLPEPDPLGTLGVDQLRPGARAVARCPSGYIAEVELAPLR